MGQEKGVSNALEWVFHMKSGYGSTFDTWRQVQLSKSTKLLPIPSGYSHGIMGDTINARFGQL